MYYIIETVFKHPKFSAYFVSDGCFRAGAKCRITAVEPGKGHSIQLVQAELPHTHSPYQTITKTCL